MVIRHSYSKEVMLSKDISLFGTINFPLPFQVVRKRINISFAHHFFAYPIELNWYIDIKEKYSKIRYLIQAGGQRFLLSA